MKIENLFQLILISFMALIACNVDLKPELVPKSIRITLSADSSSVELHRVPKTILDYLQTDSLSQQEWQSFFSVYRDASDPEFRDMQPALDGNYILKDSLILFIPNEKFKKDSAYNARCYTRHLMAKPSDIIKGQKLSGQTEVIEFGFKR